MQEGTRRKVRNGRSINIWNDGWIPGNKDGRVQTDKPPNCDVSKVEDLIRGFRWNKYVIFSTFNKKDAEKILQIPVSLSRREDNNYWIHSEIGQYTVKSGYKLLCDWSEQRKNKEEALGETSVASNFSNIWKKLWKLNVKGKLKHFLWKCIKGILPVNNQVYKRTGKGDPICKGCGEQVETIEHMLLSCRRAREVWKMAPIQWDEILAQSGNFSYWWNEVMEAAKRNKVRATLS